MSKWLWLVVAAVGLSGCADLGCMGRCGSHAHNSSSLVEFLYPQGAQPPAKDAIPQLRIPLRVGLTFLPTNGADPAGGLDAAHREELLERIRQRFADRKFIADIVVIPDYYLANQRGFAGLEAVQRLYGLDLMALVSYDQVTYLDENNWSLGYLTIVGAYVLKGSRHDVSSLIDLAVVDPASRSLVLRAGGTDTRHGTTTLISSDRETREAALASYNLATGQMLDHFDAALAKFEADVRSGKAAAKLVRKNDSTHSRGGGGGALDWPSILALLLLVTVSRPAVGKVRRAR